MPKSFPKCKTLSGDEVVYIIEKVIEARSIVFERRGRPKTTKEKDIAGREVAQLFSKIVQPIYYYRTDTKGMSPRMATPLIENEKELARYYKDCQEDAERIANLFKKDMKTEYLQEAIFDAIATQIYFIRREYKAQRAKNPPYAMVSGTKNGSRKKKTSTRKKE